MTTDVPDVRTEARRMCAANTALIIEVGRLTRALRRMVRALESRIAQAAPARTESEAP